MAVGFLPRCHTIVAELSYLPRRRMVSGMNPSVELVNTVIPVAHYADRPRRRSCFFGNDEHTSQTAQASSSSTAIRAIRSALT